MLDALLEGLVEGTEAFLGLGDGLASERDQDAAEGLGLREAGMPAVVVERELVSAVEDARQDQPADPAQQDTGLGGEDLGPAPTPPKSSGP